MKKPVGQSGMTLIEVLVVMAAILVLAFMLLPPGPRQRSAAITAACMRNQKQVALGCIMWNSDNDGKYPWQASTVTNGTMELITNGQASAQFLALNSYIKYTAVYVCPADQSREKATNMDTFSNHNLSYFVDVDVSSNNPAAMILTGDRHLLAGGKPVAPGLFQYTNTMVMGWTRESHAPGLTQSLGVLGFADGHAQVVKGKDSDALFKQQGMAAERLEVP